MQQETGHIFQEPPSDLDETWRHGAILGGMAEGAYDLVALAEAFKLAGDSLAKQALNASEPYELVHPILYNYRHCLELYLKAVVRPTKKSHDLQSLLTELSELVKARHSQELPAWFAGVIAEFSDYDPIGTAFRYPEVGVVSQTTGDRGEFWIDLPYLMQWRTESSRAFVG